MKVFVFVFAIIVFVEAVPKARLKFRNLYKTPIVETKSKITPRIVGGWEAEPHSIPYQAFLEVYSLTSGGWYCGGVLISKNYLLTAGHCGDGAWEVYVTLGAHHIFNKEDTQVTVFTGNVTVHPEYDLHSIRNDLAIIALPGGVRLNDAINFVNLPKRSDADLIYEGATARMSGWGLTSDSATSLSEVLNYVDVVVLHTDDCQVIYGELNESQMCAIAAGLVSVCDGDSGGLIGIVSFGADVCEGGYPSGFTRVASFLDWIAANTDVQIQ